MLAIDLYTQPIRRLGAFFVLAFFGLHMGFAQLTIDDFEVNSPSCAGFDDGSAQVFYSGGTAPFTVTWSDGQTGDFALGLTAGTYSVTIVDDLGEEVSGSVDITEPDPISVTAVLTQPVCPDDPTGEIAVTPAGGIPPYDVYWSTTDIGPVLSNVPAGSYFVFVIDLNGCFFSQQFILEASDTEPPVLVAHSAVVPLNPVTGTAVMEPSLFVDMVTDNCQIGGVNVAPLQKDCDNLGPNSIFVSALDNSGNITTVQVTATIVDITPPVLAPENITVAIGADGTVSVDPEEVAGASVDNCSIATLSLDISTFDCSNIGENTVTLTATDGSGNASTATVIITVEDNEAPTVVTQNISIELDADGQAVIAPSELDGGSGDNCGILVLEASQTTFTCDDLNNGNPVEVTLTVTDVNGNEGAATALVTVTDPIEPEIICPSNVTGTYCQIVLYNEPFATDNCSVTIEQTEGLGSGSLFQFGSSTETFTATDAFGNTATCSFTVTITNDFDIQATVNHVSCNGEADGSVVLSVAGGTPPYLYFWSPMGPDNLPSGIYTVTIFDNIGCESVHTYVINEPAPLEITVMDVVHEVNSQGNGSFTLVVEGGTPPYSYSGNSFNDTLVVDELSAGAYNIEVTDANDCAINTSVTIDNILGTSDPEILEGFSVSPNPAGDFATVDIRLRESTLFRIDLIDMNGRNIQSWPSVNAKQQTMRLDLSGLAPGIYGIRLSVDGKVTVRMIAVE